MPQDEGEVQRLGTAIAGFYGGTVHDAVDEIQVRHNFFIRNIQLKSILSLVEALFVKKL